MTLADDSAAATVAFLAEAGARQLGHRGGRSLLDHLLGTYIILRRWDQPDWLCQAGLIHSVYSTDQYRQGLLSPSRRTEVAEVAGAQAERIAYLFCVTPRRPLFAGTHLWARGLPSRAMAGAGDAAGGDPPTRDELDGLVLLHMANLAEQAHGADGRPGRWLLRVRDLAEYLIDSDTVTPPPFVAQLGAFSDADESLAHRAYVKAISDDGQTRANGLALAAAACPVIPEPCVWLAHLARCREEIATTRAWATQARKRLLELGTPWDRRLSFEEWLALIDALEQSPGEHEPSEVKIVDPRALLEASIGQAPAHRPPAPNTIAAPDAAAGRKRFQRYVETLNDGHGASSGAIYPDLPSRPWHD
ncbi:MAG TPA: hypothetical protein VGL51_19805, partial [Solirubrobacteraceae bacterium]